MRSVHGALGRGEAVGTGGAPGGCDSAFHPGPHCQASGKRHLNFLFPSSVPAWHVSRLEQQRSSGRLTKNRKRAFDSRSRTLKSVTNGLATACLMPRAAREATVCRLRGAGVVLRSESVRPLL